MNGSLNNGKSAFLRSALRISVILSRLALRMSFKPCGAQ
jgi:hypothetical protein